MQVVFCNAGYMLTGFLHTRSLEELMANLSCNATSAVQITHYFLQIMVSRPLVVLLLLLVPAGWAAAAAAAGACGWCCGTAPWLQVVSAPAALLLSHP